MNFRPIFFLLVFVNLAFFVWAAGYLGESSEGREPQRLGQQLHPEQLRVVQNIPDAAQPSATHAAPTSPAAPVASTPPASPPAVLPKIPKDSAP